MNQKQFDKSSLKNVMTVEQAQAQGFQCLDASCSESDATRAAQLEKLTAKYAPFFHVAVAVRTTSLKTFSAYPVFIRIRAFDRTLSVLDQTLEAKRAEVVAHMVERAKDFVDRIFADLAKVGNDLNLYAPYPNNARSYSYRAEVDRHNFVMHLTSHTGSYTGSFNKDRDGNHIPQIVTRDDAKVAKYLVRAEEDANADFDSFLVKLAGKVGQVTEATLDGTYLWNHSVLTVKTEAGKTVKWMTQMILNVSVLGKLFNQWPTRKMSAL